MTSTASVQSYDVIVTGSPRIGIIAGERVHMDSPAAYTRVRGGDLRTVAHLASAARAEHPGADVLADIDVVIAPDAAGARALLTTTELQSGVLGYVGTPAGLAGLLADIHTLGIADGAVLRPRAVGVAELILDRVLPLLETLCGTTGPRFS